MNNINNKAQEPLIVTSYSSIFIYPFLFKREYWADVISELMNITSSWKLDFYDTDDEYKVDRLRYFFPYVQNFLYPTAKWPVEIKENYKYSENFFIKHQVTNLLKECTCVRFKYDFQNPGDDQFELGLEGKTLPCKFYRLSLLLFPTGVGLVIFDIVIDQSEVKFDELIYVNDLFRGLNKFHKNREIAFMQFENEKGLVRKSIKEYIDSIVILPQKAKPAQDYDIFVDKLMHYCYVALESKKLNVNKDDILYEQFRTMSLGKLPVKINRSEKDIEEWEMCRWANTRMSFSPADGGVIFCYVPPREDGKSIKSPQATRRDVRNYYLDTLLLALFMRLSLLNFSWELSQTRSLVNMQSKIEKLRFSILDFSNRCWFSQLTVSPYGQEIWERWKNTMKLETLYQEVKGQLGELDDYISKKRQDSLSFWGGVIAAVAIPFTLVFSYYGQNFKDFDNLYISNAISQTWIWILVFTVVILIIFAGKRISYHCSNLWSNVKKIIFSLGSMGYNFFQGRHNKNKLKTYQN